MTKDEAIKDIEENILPVVGGKSLRMAIDALKKQPEPHYGEWCMDCKEYDKERHCCRVIRQTLQDAQPEVAKRIVGMSRDGMTMWYQCDMCHEPVDEKDAFCRGCGRRFEDE